MRKRNNQIRTIYSGAYKELWNQPEEVWEEVWPFYEEREIPVPDGGWVKFEVVPGIWVLVSHSEWCRILVSRDEPENWETGPGYGENE